MTIETEKDCETLLDEIRQSQDEKKDYFIEVAEGKHPGKKLCQQRLVIQLYEVVDYDKDKLVYEETKEDEQQNYDYLKECSVNIDKMALQFANELQQHERFSIEEFNLFFRPYEADKRNEIEAEIKCVDLKTGTIQELADVSPETLKRIARILAEQVKAGEGKEKKAD